MPARVQLALNVSDLDEAVTFYTRLFDTPPAKRRPGYANFAVAEPPLKLVLIEGETGGSLNHLGIEVESVDEVRSAGDRMSEQGLNTTDANEETCCFALQNKFWANDGDGLPWEVYTVLADAPNDKSLSGGSEPSATACCGAEQQAEGEGSPTAVAGPCC